MKNKLLGQCALCGKEDYLTAEHIPPEKAFNSGKIHVHDLLEDMGREQYYGNKTNPQYTINQNGFKVYTLCSSCNNNTGSWYGDSYVEFVKQFTPIITVLHGNVNELFCGKVVDIYPLRVIKQILSMFCSINNNDQEIADIREFVCNKESCQKLTRFRLYLYLNYSNEYKLIPFQKKITHNIDFSEIYSEDTMSEIATYPLGFILSLDEKNPRDDLVDITGFADCTYGEKCDAELTIPIKERWSPYIGDFRLKEDIMKTKEDAEHE